MATFFLTDKTCWATVHFLFVKNFPSESFCLYTREAKKLRDCSLFTSLFLELTIEQLLNNGGGFVFVGALDVNGHLGVVAGTHGDDAHNGFGIDSGIVAGEGYFTFELVA